MMPKDITHPVKDIKNPIDKNVPLTRLTTKTLNKLIEAASQMPNSYKVTRMIMLAKPSFTPGIPMLGIKDSKIAMTIAPAVKTPNNAIFCTFIF